MFWLWRKLPSHLPYGKGKFVPGACDVMTGYDKDGIFARLYYPTDLEGKISDYHSRWIPWVPDDNYFRGFSIVSSIWERIIRLIFWIYSGRIHIPIVYGEKPKKDGHFQCIVFSHGLGAARFMYSSIAIDLASRGFLVACLEHRDESACTTYFYKSQDDVINDRRTMIEHNRVEFGDAHYGTRHAQVSHRSDECRKMIDLLYATNEGNPPENILSNLPSEKNVQFNLNTFKNRLELNDLAMMGHSFGAATSLLTVSKDHRLKVGILLDTWMFPIKEVLDQIEQIAQPLLFINTQTFHIKSNVNALEKILNYEQRDNRTMHTMLKTTHENQCDTPFVFGYKLNWFMTKLKPENALRINNHLILQFLNQYINFPKNVDESIEYLKRESHNIEEGLTKPWL